MYRKKGQQGPGKVTGDNSVLTVDGKLKILQVESIIINKEFLNLRMMSVTVTFKMAELLHSGMKAEVQPAYGEGPAHGPVGAEGKAGPRTHISCTPSQARSVSGSCLHRQVSVPPGPTEDPGKTLPLHLQHLIPGGHLARAPERGAADGM